MNIPNFIFVYAPGKMGGAGCMATIGATYAYPVSNYMVSHAFIPALKSYTTYSASICDILTRHAVMMRVPSSKGELPAISLEWLLIYYERARSARSSFFNFGEKSEYERPAGRPAVVTVLRRLYLSNHETD